MPSRKVLDKLSTIALNLSVEINLAGCHEGRGSLAEFGNGDFLQK